MKKFKIKIDVEVHDEVTPDDFIDKFLDFLKQNDWSSPGGGIQFDDENKSTKEEKENAK